jgi:hypothetical protein
MSDGTADANLSPIIPDQTGAGYFTSGLTPTSASATFVLPTFTCTGVQLDIIEVAVNWSTGTPPSALDEVLINCAGAGVAPTYSTLVSGVSANAIQTLNVAPGDKLKASVSGSAIQTTATLNDLTTKHKVTSAGAAESTGGISAAFVLSRNTLDPTTPTFGTLTFRSMTVDGTLLSASTSFTQDMTSASSVVQVHTKPISSLGAGVLVFRHS